MFIYCLPGPSKWSTGLCRTRLGLAASAAPTPSARHAFTQTYSSQSGLEIEPPSPCELSVFLAALSGYTLHAARRSFLSSVVSCMRDLARRSPRGPSVPRASPLSGPRDRPWFIYTSCLSYVFVLSFAVACSDIVEHAY